MQVPKRRADAFQKIDNGPVYLTQEGFERLQDRVVRLKKSLPALAEEAGQQAAMGDRSENDGYKQAKSILRRTHRQIFSAEDQLKRVVVIKKGVNATHTVQLGSRVTVEIDGKQKIFEILGSQETNPTHGRISLNSPLGAALIDHATGDVVTIKTPNGPRDYRIIEIQ